MSFKNIIKEVVKDFKGSEPISTEATTKILEQLNAEGIEYTNIEVEKNHNLALALWSAGTYQARMLSIMMEDLDKVNDEQLDKQITEIEHRELADVYCTRVAAESGLMDKKINDWADSDKAIVRRAAYKLLAIKAVDDIPETDTCFSSYLNKIENCIEKEDDCVVEAMKKAVVAIGTRSLPLNLLATSIAKKIRTVKVSDPNLEVDFCPYTALGSDMVKAKMC